MALSRSSIFFLIFVVLVSGIVGARELHDFKVIKMFVFGDSYADTGNLNKSQVTWQPPYGITNPGKPAGRFSNGIIFTDFFAKFLRQRTPVAYTRWVHHPSNKLTHGVNFAFGGSGVFFTFPNLPNMTTQIDFFQHLLATSQITHSDIESAAFVVTLSGNDYSAFLRNGGSISNITTVIQSVVTQLVENLKRISQMGARKIIVSGLPPLGCIPSQTQPIGYSACIDIENQATLFHNALLQQAVAVLNNSSSSSKFLMLDFYQAFQTVITTKKNYKGDVSFATPLTPCCQGIGSGNSCGSVDANGTKLYTVCSDRSGAFFWDGAHPTQAGWETVFSLVKKNIGQFLGL